MIHCLNTFLIVSILLLSQPANSADVEKNNPLTAVESVDLNRYMGTWYEIARLPNRFQKICDGEVTATYKLQDDGTISVVNRCRDSEGRLEEAEGVAKLADEEGRTSKLKVRFAPGFLSFLPFVWGNYWIIDLAADYGYAVVGEPSRRYLWILARSSVMEEAEFQAVLDRIRGKGYSLDNLVRTLQTSE